jgi:hypothetical protein
MSAIRGSWGEVTDGELAKLGNPLRESSGTRLKMWGRGRYWRRVGELVTRDREQVNGEKWAQAIRWTLGKVATRRPVGHIDETTVGPRHRTLGIKPEVDPDGGIVLVGETERGEVRVALEDVVRKRYEGPDTSYVVDIGSLAALGVSTDRLPNKEQKVFD